MRHGVGIRVHNICELRMVPRLSRYGYGQTNHQQQPKDQQADEGGEFQSRMSAHGALSSSEHRVQSGQSTTPSSPGEKGAGQAGVGLMQQGCQAPSTAPVPPGTRNKARQLAV